MRNAFARVMVFAVSGIAATSFGGFARADEDDANRASICDGRRVELERDVLHCGNCANACADGDVCRAGACQPLRHERERRIELPRPRPQPGPLVLTGAWTPHGPFIGGRLDAIITEGTSTLLVGSPGGGLWRTTNNGASWTQPLSYALGDYNITHFEFDRNNAGNLFVTTYNGLYSTSDLGDHLTPLVGQGAVPAPLLPLAVGGRGSNHTTDPYAFAQLVVGGQRIVLYGQTCNGLWYSYDGVHFTQSWPFSGGSGNQDNCIQSLTADDSTGYVYFSTMGGSDSDPAHVYRSSSPWTAATPSLSWVAANHGLPLGLGVNSITQTSAYGGGSYRPNNLAALATNPQDGYSQQVWETTDGLNWSLASGQPYNGNWDARVIAYPGGNDIFVGMPVGWQSTTFGAFWQPFSSTANEHPDVRALFFNQSLGYVWDTTDGTNSSNSYNNITRWSWPGGGGYVTSPTKIPVTGLSGWQAYFMEAGAANNFAGRRIFVGAQDNGILCSDLGGSSWSTSGGPPSGSGDSIALKFAPSSPSRAFFYNNDGDLWYSNNANANNCANVTWTAISVGAIDPPIWIHSMLAVHPTNANKAYLAQNNQQLTVVQVGGSVTTHTTPATPNSVFVDNSGNVYIGTIGAGIYKSTNDGASWTPFGLNTSSPAAVLELGWSSTGGGAGTWFAATTSGLYRMPPGGSWALADGGNGYTVSAVRVDPSCPTRVYDGFGYIGPMGQHRGGVDVSSDGGVTWRSMTSGLPLHQGPIAALQVDPLASRYLYAASYGQGAWTYDYGANPSCP